MSPIAVTLINPVTSVFANLVAGIFIAELPTVGTVLGGVLVISAVVVSAQNVGEKAG
jgi:drug/metabolite transporter (DMT)-like permease